MEKARSEWIDPTKSRTQFQDYARECEERRARALELSESTQLRDASILTKHVLPMFGSMRLGGIRRTHVQGWIDGLIKKGYARDTVRRALEILTRVLADAVENDFIFKNPCRGITVRLSVDNQEREPRSLSPDEVRRFADAMGEIEPRYRALVLLGAYAGLRPGELGGLAETDIDFLRRSLTVRRAVKEPGGRLTVGELKTHRSGRNITLSPFLVEVLAAHMASYPPNADGLIFAGQRGAPMSPNRLRGRAWRKAVEASGISCTPNDLRHTHSTWMAQMGAHPAVMQARMGHEDSRMSLDVYTHHQPGMDKEVAAGMERLYRASVAPVGTSEGSAGSC